MRKNGLGGTVKNNAGGTISGSGAGVYVKNTAAGTVINSGTISVVGTSGNGVILGHGGSVTNFVNAPTIGATPTSAHFLAGSGGIGTSGNGGAGGFSSAVGEMGAELGATVNLEAAPLKYEGLSYTEIWISESQERMVLSVPPDKLAHHIS